METTTLLSSVSAMLRVKFVLLSPVRTVTKLTGCHWC